MAAVLSTIPLLNRLLEIAQEEAAKKGHIIRSFEKGADRHETFYSGVCIVCFATARITCSAHKYSRIGTAYGRNCKPG
jgi:hypothetical protein